MAYGVASIVMAVLALIATIVVGAQLDGSSRRLLDRVDRIEGTLDTTASALDQGVASAARFSGALDELGPTLERTTSALRSGATTLAELATTADRISLLGNRPFAGLTSALSSTAGELDRLADSTEGNAATLGGSRDALDRMAAVLPPVAERLRTLRSNLEADVRAVLDDVQRLVPLAGAAFAAWLGLPGGGAFLIGRRLRRALDD